LSEVTKGGDISLSTSFLSAFLVSFTPSYRLTHFSPAYIHIRTQNIMLTYVTVIYF
jgi:hypothetical protein